MTSEEVVRRVIAEHGFEGGYSLDGPMKKELGADSLDLVQMAIDVEDELHIEIPNNAFDKIWTIRDFITVVDKCRQPKTEA